MRIRAALLAIIVGVGCSAKSGDDGDTGDTTATGAATETGTPTGGAAGGLGTACTHNGRTELQGPLLTPFDPACGDALCVLADSSRGPTDPCTSDLDCNAFDPDKQRFTCEAGECRVAHAYALERSMCASSCAADSDCAGADPATKCEFGFTCVIITASCCTPMCVCLDDVAQGSIDAATAECAMLPEPGCEF